MVFFFKKKKRLVNEDALSSCHDEHITYIGVCRQALICIPKYSRLFVLFCSLVIWEGNLGPPAY